MAIRQLGRCCDPAVTDQACCMQSRGERSSSPRKRPREHAVECVCCRQAGKAACFASELEFNQHQLSQEHLKTIRDMLLQYYGASLSAPEHMSPLPKVALPLQNGIYVIRSSWSAKEAWSMLFSFVGKSEIYGVGQLDICSRTSGLQHKVFSQFCCTLLLYFGKARIFGGLHACTNSALSAT